MKYKFALLAKDMHNSVLPRTYDFYGKSLGYEVDFNIINVNENELAETLEKMRSELDGFTVTMPYKVKIMEFCDELDVSAEKCGSSNTVLVKDGKFIGYNTDGWGMVKCLALKGYSFEGKNVVLVGAGGVALSIAYNLSINKVKHVDVLNKFPNETERLLARMDDRFTGYDLTDENLIRYGVKNKEDVEFFRKLNASTILNRGLIFPEQLKNLDSDTMLARR